MIVLYATTNNLLLDQVSNSNSLTFTIFWNQNIKISLHVYGLEKRFKCEMKNTKKIQFEVAFQIKFYFILRNFLLSHCDCTPGLIKHYI